jgi:hypothetical protein
MALRMNVTPSNGHDPWNLWLTRGIMAGWIMLELIVASFLVYQIYLGK